MKIAKLALPIVCLCTLSACGTKTTKQGFLDAANKVEEHKYKKITIKYLYEENDNKEESECTYNLQNDEYVAEKNDFNNNYLLYFAIDEVAKNVDIDETTFDSFKSTAKSYDENAKISCNITYYIKPFKIVGKFKASYNKDEMSGEIKADLKYEFNKYGYATYLEATQTRISEINENGFKKVTEKTTTSKVTLTYKD